MNNDKAMNHLRKVLNRELLSLEVLADKDTLSEIENVKSFTFKKTLKLPKKGDE